MAAYPAHLAPDDIFRTFRETINSVIDDIQALVGGGSFTDLTLGPGAINSISSTDQSLIIGTVGSTNLIFDSNEIQSRNNGVNNAFHLNRFGGDVILGNDVTSNLTVSGNITESGVQLNAKYLGISDIAADSDKLGNVSSTLFARNDGDDITGDFVFDNDIQLSGKEVGGTIRNIIKMNASDILEIGSITNDVTLMSLNDPLVNVGGNVFTGIHSGNINNQTGGTSLPITYFMGGF